MPYNWQPKSLAKLKYDEKTNTHSGNSFSICPVLLMNEIRIYHSVWKSCIILLLCLGLVFLGARLILDGKDHVWLWGIGWVWVITIIFGLDILLFLCLLFRERIKDKPFLVITDKSVVMDGLFKSSEILFADVEKFFFLDTVGIKSIGIQYTKEAEARLTAARRVVGRFNKFTAGAQVGIPVFNLSISPDIILKHLTERLEAFKKA